MEYKYNTKGKLIKYKHPLYRIYKDMKNRCYNKNNKDYKSYGDRNIIVTENWLGSEGFYKFLEDMGEKPSKFHSLDRINNDLGYSKENCRWATKLQQTSNRRISNKTPGVSWKKDLNKWVAYVFINGKHKYLGVYKEEKDAIAIRQKSLIENNLN